MTRILWVGGGTAGPVTPLIALTEILRERADFEILGLVGTRSGPERELVHAAGLKFFSITTGKWRRYVDVRNLAAPFQVLVGFFEALHLLQTLKPSVVFSGGSFVGVPVIFAAWFLGIPTMSHEQDVRASFANRIVAPLVNFITVVFPETVAARWKKAVVTGNPIRSSILEGDRDRAMERFNLEWRVPIVLVFGGGTGAEALNHLVVESLPELVKFCQVIHLTGKGKGGLIETVTETVRSRYHQYEFLKDEMADAYAAADLVVARAGVGTITELAALGKPAIIVPILGSHQEENAAYLEERKAALVESQKILTSEIVTGFIQRLLADQELRDLLGKRIGMLHNPFASQKIVNLILEVAKESDGIDSSGNA